jgi:hypothetical protein
MGTTVENPNPPPLGPRLPPLAPKLPPPALAWLLLEEEGYAEHDGSCLPFIQLHSSQPVKCNICRYATVEDKRYQSWGVFQESF